MKKIRCDFAGEDFLEILPVNSFDISLDVKQVFLDVEQDGKRSRIRIGADKIRKLRKQLKRALIEIEGERPETPTEDNWFSKGKLVKVVANNNNHEFPIGENVKIVSGIEKDTHVFAKAEYLDGHDFWWVRKDDCEPVA